MRGCLVTLVVSLLNYETVGRGLNRPKGGNSLPDSCATCIPVMMSLENASPSQGSAQKLYLNRNWRSFNKLLLSSFSIMIQFLAKLQASNGSLT